MGEDEITKAARESAKERQELQERLDRAAAEWERREKEEAAEHKRLKALAGCPFRAGMGWPTNRCPEKRGPDGCGLWVDRGGWATGCALFVLGVAVARGLDVNAQVYPE